MGSKAARDAAMWHGAVDVDAGLGLVRLGSRRAARAKVQGHCTKARAGTRPGAGESAGGRGMARGLAARPLTDAGGRAGGRAGGKAQDRHREEATVPWAAGPLARLSYLPSDSVK